MSNLYLKLEAHAGSEISETCSEALSVARRIGIPVEFSFNGIRVIVREHNSVGELVGAWNVVRMSDGKFKMVSV